MIIRAIAKTTLKEAFIDYMDFEAGEKQIHVNYDVYFTCHGWCNER